MSGPAPIFVKVPLPPSVPYSDNDRVVPATATLKRQFPFKVTWPLEGKMELAPEPLLTVLLVPVPLRTRILSTVAPRLKSWRVAPAVRLRVLVASPSPEVEVSTLKVPPETLMSPNAESTDTPTSETWFELTLVSV